MEHKTAQERQLENVCLLKPYHMKHPDTVHSTKVCRTWGWYIVPNHGGSLRRLWILSRLIFTSFIAISHGGGLVRHNEYIIGQLWLMPALNWSPGICITIPAVSAATVWGTRFMVKIKVASAWSSWYSARQYMINKQEVEINEARQLHKRLH